MCNCKYSDKQIKTYPDGQTWEDENTRVEIINGKMEVTLNLGDYEAEGFEEIEINYCPFCGEKVIK